MTSLRNPAWTVLSAALALVACGDADEPAIDPAAADSAGSLASDAAANPAAGTRPSGSPSLVSKEGRIEDGVECPILRTPDGETWALSLGEADFGPGEYVSVTGELMDASICMQGEGTILPRTIDAQEPPARDRDPARSGGVALTSDYVVGEWVAKGGDCDLPDFAITTNANGMALLRAQVNGERTTAAVDVGRTPEIHFDAPLPPAPIETRGPDGLAVMLDEGAGSFLLGSERITGDGVVFVKCA